MNEIPSAHETPPQPVALTPVKEAIRVSQEEFVDDTAGPSVDKSEYVPGHGDASKTNQTAREEDA